MLTNKAFREYCSETRKKLCSMELVILGMIVLVCIPSKWGVVVGLAEMKIM